MGRKILVVSDSHGRMDYLRKAIEAFGPRGRDLEMMIHLGDIQCPVEQITGMVDCPVEIVRGNNDFNPELPGTKLVEIGDEVAMITHGHRYGCYHGTEEMKELAAANGAGMVLFGHTHKPLLELDGEGQSHESGKHFPAKTGRVLSDVFGHHDRRRWKNEFFDCGDVRRVTK